MKNSARGVILFAVALDLSVLGIVILAATRHNLEVVVLTVEVMALLVGVPLLCLHIADLRAKMGETDSDRNEDNVEL
jgi:hypothetical protein